jgi:uncharacterized NAD(P)/FAD-binding protein YdhS
MAHMQQSSAPSDDDDLMAELVQWLRDEVAPVAQSGANWKAVLNGKGMSDWAFVIEKHGSRRKYLRQDSE